MIRKMMYFIVVAFLALSACGGEETTSQTQRDQGVISEPKEQDRAEGVVYEGEIYAGWPYQ